MNRYVKTGLLAGLILAGCLCLLLVWLNSGAGPIVILANNALLICLFIYAFCRGNAVVDRGVAKGKITPQHAASWKRWLRPLSAIGAICMLMSLILQLTAKH